MLLYPSLLFLQPAASGSGSLGFLETQRIFGDLKLVKTKLLEQFLNGSTIDPGATWSFFWWGPPCALWDVEQHPWSRCQEHPALPSWENPGCVWTSPRVPGGKPAWPENLWLMP